MKSLVVNSLKVLILVSAYFALSSANADILSKYKRSALKRLQVSETRSNTKVAALETYYGKRFSVKDISGTTRSIQDVSKLLRNRDIRLNTGRVIRSGDIEYVYSPNARSPHERAPEERRPHERNPDNGPLSKRPHE